MIDQSRVQNVCNSSGKFRQWTRCNWTLYTVSSTLLLTSLTPGSLNDDKHELSGKKWTLCYFDVVYEDLISGQVD